MTETETMCEDTGKPCRWASEEWTDAAGNLESWDNYCEDCGRWRTWEKQEAGYFGWL